MCEQILSTINVNLSDGSFTISGSESFIESNREVILGFVERNTTIKSKPHPVSIDNVAAKENTTPTYTEEEKTPNKPEEDKYVEAGVYHVDPEDGTVSILKTIPGKSFSEKAKNIALIVMYIKKQKIAGSSIIPLCEKHNCYDNKNFATTFSNEKANFIKKGKGQSWTIELTHPGEQAAIALLEEMVTNATK